MNIQLSVLNQRDFDKFLLAKRGAVQMGVIGVIGTTAININRDAKEKAPVDTGGTRARIQIASFDGGLVVEVYVAQASAKYVEEGTGPAVGHAPYQPPASALMGWVKRHGMPPGTEFAIARAIKARGTKPRPFFYPAVERNAAGYQDRISAAIEKALKGK